MNSITKYLGLVWIGTFFLAPSLFGQAGNDNPGGPTAEYHGSITTAGNYDPYTGNARREIDDIVVPGAVGAYPLKYTRSISTRSLPIGWTGNYTWSVSIYNPDTNNCTDRHTCGPEGHVVYPEGGAFDLEPSGTPGIWPLDANGRHGADDILVQCSVVANSGCEPQAAAEIRRADGGKVLFERLPTAGNEYRAYAILDPYGQRTTLTYYDTLGYRMWKVTEPGGRYLEFIYSQGGPLTTVRANDGRGNIMESVNYGYDQGLSHVYYDDGAVATYTYITPNNYVPPDQVDPNQPTYANLIHSCDDPRYAGPMKYIEYEYVSSTEVPDVARGQIKAEKNILGQRVSSTTYPPAFANPSNDPNWYRRTETRGGGSSRTVNYAYHNPANNLFGISWTDFKNQTFTDTTTPGTGWTITDPRGNTTTYETEPVVGALSKITYPATSDNGVTTREYTFSGPNVSYNPYFHYGEKDESGNWTYFDRDGNNRVTKITFPDNSSEEFTYNNFGQVLTHKLKSGGTESFEYDNNPNGAATRGLKTKHTDALGNVTTYQYYSSGPNTDRPSQVSDARNNVTTYEYNLRGQVTKVTHPDSSFVQSAYNLDGTTAWTSDELGHTTSYTYDEYKRVLTVTNPMGETTTNSYGLNPVTWGDPLLHTTNSVKYTLSPMNKNVVYDYDENLRKELQVAAMGTADEAWSFFEYDEVGNLKKITDPRWKETTFTYDERNRQKTVTDPLGHKTETTYDAVGNKLTIKRQDNPPEQFVYDSMNRVKEHIDELGYHRFMGYDLAGNMSSQKDENGNVYTYGYDALNRKTSMIYPQNAATELWTYDEVGNVKTHTNRAGNVQIYALADNRNRPTSFSWSNEDPASTTPGQSFEYDAKSRLTRTYNAEADIHFTYDDADRKSREPETIDSFGVSRTPTGRGPDDHDGNLSRTIYPAGWQFIYEHTQRNQLANVKLDPALYGSDYNTPVVAYIYDAAGNRSQRTLLNGGTTSYAVDDANRMYSQSSSFANGQTGRFDYGFDQLNRRRYEQRNLGLADAFQFDARDEVTGYQRDGVLNNDGSVTNAAAASTLGFDGTGNRTQVAGSWAPNTYAVNTLNQYTSDVGGAAGYDAKGNLASYAGWTVTYDAVNRLTELHNNALNRHIIYKYDALNRRIAQSVNSAVTSYVFDNWNQIEERPTDGRQPRCFLFGAATNEVVVSFGSGYQNYFYFQDGRGNTSHLTDNGNALIERYTYDLNGSASTFDGNGNPAVVSAVDNRFLFAGAILLPETGLYDMRNRMYFPSWSRFLQTDPIGFKVEGNKPSTEAAARFWPGKAPENFTSTELNLYRYCDNDPVNHSDPMGLTIEYDYPNPHDEATARALVNRLERMGGEIASRVKQLQDSQNTHRFIPIQPNQSGWEKYNLPPREKGDTTNRTVPDENKAARSGRPGTGSKIELDPNNWKDPAGNRRDPVEAAGHEVDHAAAIDQGRRLSQPAEENRARDFQKQIREKLKQH